MGWQVSVFLIVVYFCFVDCCLFCYLYNVC